MKGFISSMTQDATDQCRVSAVLVREYATKRFGAVCALEDGSITLYPGEAHALLGENGAGKSTLVKILAGVHGADSGQLLMDGKPVVFNGPVASRAAGISIIYQEPTLFPDLTVAENIFMGRQPLRPGRRVDRASMNRLATELFARLGVQLDPDRVAPGLSPDDHRGGAAVRGDRGPSLPGCGRAVHLAPARRGLRELPAGHGHARRPVRPHRADRGRHDRRHHPVDGGTRP